MNGVVKKSDITNTGGAKQIKNVQFCKWAGYANQRPVASFEIYRRTLTAAEVIDAMEKSATTRLGKK